MANNRFDTPSRIDYDMQYNVPKIFMPNYEALGAIIENEDQKKQIVDALLEKMPNAIAQDKPAQDLMAKQLEGMTKELTDAFSSGDMGAYRTKRRDIERRIKSNWQPSGSFSIMQSRYDQFLKEKEQADKLREKYPEYATVNANLDDKFWMDNIQGMNLDDKSSWKSLPSREYNAYQNYQKALSDILKDMRPDKEDVIQIGNKWITKTTKEEVKPEDILAAEKMLRNNPLYSKQLQMEAYGKGYFTPERRSTMKGLYSSNISNSYDADLAQLKDLSKLSEKEIAATQRDLNVILGINLEVNGKLDDKTKEAATQAIEKLTKEKADKLAEVDAYDNEKLDEISQDHYVSNTYGIPNANVYGYRQLGKNLDFNQEYGIRLREQLNFDNLKAIEEMRTKSSPLALPGQAWNQKFDNVKTQVETLIKSVGANLTALRSSYGIPEGVKLESLLDPAKFKEVTGKTDADYKIYKDQWNTIQQDHETMVKLNQSLMGTTDDKFIWKAGTQGKAFEDEVKRLSEVHDITPYEVLQQMKQGKLGETDPRREDRHSSFKELATKALNQSDDGYTDHRKREYEKTNGMVQSMTYVPIAGSDFDKHMKAVSAGLNPTTVSAMLANAAATGVYKKDGVPSKTASTSPIKEQDVSLVTLNGKSYLQLDVKHDNGIRSTALQPLSTVQDLNALTDENYRVLLDAISDDYGNIRNTNTAKTVYRGLGQSKLLSMANGVVPLENDIKKELQNSKYKNKAAVWMPMSSADISGVGTWSTQVYNESNDAVEDKVKINITGYDGKPLPFFNNTGEIIIPVSEYNEILGEFGGQFLPGLALKKAETSSTLKNNE